MKGKRVIWKYTFGVTDKFTIIMPFGTKILYVDTQRDVPCMWVEVKLSQIATERKFKLFGTGHEVDGELTYLGSFQLRNGDLVFHLYEEV